MGAAGGRLSNAVGRRVRPHFVRTMGEAFFVTRRRQRATNSVARRAWPRFVRTMGDAFFSRGGAELAEQREGTDLLGVDIAVFFETALATTSIVPGAVHKKYRKLNFLNCTPARTLRGSAPPREKIRTSRSRMCASRERNLRVKHQNLPFTNTRGSRTKPPRETSAPTVHACAPLTNESSLPLDRRRWLRAHIVGHTIDSAHLVDDAA